MIDPAATRLWVGRGLFVLLSALVIFVRLLPIGHLPHGLPAPDLMLCFTAAWVLRRPEFLPAPLVAALFLLADLLFQRPPGLQALMVLVATEFLRSRTQRTRDTSFAFEWMTVAGVFLILTAALRLVHAVTFTPQPALAPAMVAVMLTILAYPLTVLASNLIFGVRRAAPRDVIS